MKRIAFISGKPTSQSHLLTVRLQSPLCMDQSVHVCVCASPGSASPSHPTHLFKPFLCEPPICEPLHSKAPAFRAPYLQAWYLQPEPGWKSPVSWTMETVWIRWQRARISHLHISTALCVCSYMLCLYFDALYAICYILYATHMPCAHKSSPHIATTGLQCIVSCILYIA